MNKVQFHVIAKYLCKTEIVENSVFVFPSPFTPRTLKYRGKEKTNRVTSLCEKKASSYAFYVFFIIIIMRLISIKITGKNRKLSLAAFTMLIATFNC